jgi:hypothetical protein
MVDDDAGDDSGGASAGESRVSHLNASITISAAQEPVQQLGTSERRRHRQTNSKGAWIAVPDYVRVTRFPTTAPERRQQRAARFVI